MTRCCIILFCGLPPVRRVLAGLAPMILPKCCLVQANSTIVKPYAYLALQIQQEPNSYETIVEIDPLDLAELFGNVGGFWGEGRR